MVAAAPISPIADLNSRPRAEDPALGYLRRLAGRMSARMTGRPMDEPARMPALPPKTDTIRIQTGALILGRKQILGPLDLTLAERRIGIIGRNGSGKSTLLRMIAGLVAPDEGAVSLDGNSGGIDPWQDRKAALARIGILFQNPDHQILFPTVLEELAFGLTQQRLSRAEAEARARACLVNEGRAHWADAPVSTLSGGQKQLVCLLSILLMAPDTILLDEPFSGLDLPLQYRLQRRLAALPQRLITVSHAPESLMDCQRILWIEGGTLAADGPPTTVVPEFLAEMRRLGADDADADLAG